MKNISLMKLTGIVLISTFASSVIAADKIEKPVITKSPETIPATEKVQFSDFDIDGNGLLNSAEAEKSELLNNAFVKIDSNGDAIINRDEFSAFFQK